MARIRSENTRPEILTGSAVHATPVLVLSGLAGIEDKVRSLGFGADNHLAKPFHKDELAARIHAIVRRSKGHAQSVIEIGDLKVNVDAKAAEIGAQRVHLTSKEYQILELLALRKGASSPRRCSSTKASLR